MASGVHLSVLTVLLSMGFVTAAPAPAAALSTIEQAHAATVHCLARMPAGASEDVDDARPRDALALRCDLSFSAAAITSTSRRALSPTFDHRIYIRRWRRSFAPDPDPPRRR